MSLPSRLTIQALDEPPSVMCPFVSTSQASRAPCVGQDILRRHVRLTAQPLGQRIGQLMPQRLAGFLLYDSQEPALAVLGVGLADVGPADLGRIPSPLAGEVKQVGSKRERSAFYFSKDSQRRDDFSRAQTSR